MTQGGRIMVWLAGLVGMTSQAVSRYSTGLPHWLQGGDLREALNDDPHGELRWYRRGQSIALDIARGLHFLHSHDVSGIRVCLASGCHGRHDAGPCQDEPTG
jgi:hypothetical protein